MKKDKKSTIKTPPRGGDAAAAWDHNLKPDEKEALAQAYKDEQVRKLKLGRNIIFLIAAVNAAIAVASIFTGFNAILFSTRMLMCVALIMGAPGVKALFTTGAIVTVIVLSGVWMTPSKDTQTYQTVFTIIESACLIVSVMIIFVDERVSDYLYMRRNG